MQDLEPAELITGCTDLNIRELPGNEVIGGLEACYQLAPGNWLAFFSKNVIDLAAYKESQFYRGVPFYIPAHPHVVGDCGGLYLFNFDGNACGLPFNRSRG